MTTSKTIAALLGPTLIASAASIFINLNVWPALVDQAFHNPALVFVTGYPLFVAGLAIVYFHDRWTRSWPVVVTILGWLTLASGLSRILFSDAASWNRDKRHSNYQRNAYSGACDLSSWRTLIVQSVQERISISMRNVSQAECPDALAAAARRASKNTLAPTPNEHSAHSRKCLLRRLGRFTECRRLAQTRRTKGA
jgi:hypothetical protein